MIRVKNLSYRYSKKEKNVLENVSFAAESGKTTVF